MVLRPAPQVVALGALLPRLVEVYLAVEVLLVLLVLLRPVAGPALVVLVRAIPEEVSEARVVACSVTSRLLLLGALALAPVDLAPVVVDLAQGQLHLLPLALPLAEAQAQLSNNRSPLLMAPPALPLALSRRRITAPT